MRGAEWDLQALRFELREKGYAVVPAKVSGMREIATAAREEYLACMRSAVLHAPRHRFTRHQLASGPWRKLAIGSTNGLGDPYAQLLQTTYFDEHTCDRIAPSLSVLFQELIALRNALVDDLPDRGSVPARDGFWNACRIHHYPRGGGFMVAHRDTHFPKVLATKELAFLQVSALLSRRGRDFFTGGGFLHTKTGENISFESDDSFGDIVCFDGSIIHGVADIDPDQVMDFSETSGRLAAFCSLYEELKTD